MTLRFLLIVTLDRKHIAHKLDSYGIRGSALSLITFYLSQRSQFLAINNFKSTIQKTIQFWCSHGLDCWYPIYINDNIVQIDSSVKFLIYTDDHFSQVRLAINYFNEVMNSFPN